MNRRRARVGDGNCFQEDREQRRPILPNHIGAEMRRAAHFGTLRQDEDFKGRRDAARSRNRRYFHQNVVIPLSMHLARSPERERERGSRPLDAHTGDQENGSISQRHDLRPEPSLSFSYLAVLSYPILAVVRVCSSSFLL